MITKAPELESIAAIKADLVLPPDPDTLNFLLTHYGIEKEYIDYSGNIIEIPYTHRLKILSFFSIDIDDKIDVEKKVSAIKESLYLSLIPTVTITKEVSNSNDTNNSDLNNHITINIPTPYLNSPLKWKITLENGGTLQDSFTPNELKEIHYEELNLEKNEKNIAVSRRELPLPSLINGYHSLSISKSDSDDKNTQESIDTFLDNTNTRSLIISSPNRCYEPEWVLKDKKLKGLSVQVYSLISEKNWGMGNFSDLKQLITRSSSLKIDFIVLNPLHFLDANNPDHCSPYSPMDRRFINPLYIDPTIEPDFLACEKIAAYLQKRSVLKSINASKELTYIDYQAVSQLKYNIFSKMFAYFKKNDLKKNSARAQAFNTYIEKKGPSTLLFAEHQAHKSRHIFSYSGNPKFHLYLQWIAESQLESCQQLAVDMGMPVGLIRDLAVGGDGHSTEVELNQDLFCTKASIGAPPDPLAPQGQNWGLPPIKPCALKQTGYAHFIDLLYTNMIHCGALRIDHVMALMRLWWCPSQNHNGEGAYVHYPVEALFAILRLESQRNQCMVIGEDLGVVPPEIHEHMSSSAVFSNVLFYFEKYDHIHFKKPEHIAHKSLAMVANHDVPTLAGWWNKSDLALRKKIGLYKTDHEFNETLGARESDLIQILHWLNEQGLLPEKWQDFNIHKSFDRALLDAILTANSRSAAQLVSIQVDDLCLTELPINIPGTCDEYPNWRRKLPLNTNNIFSDTSIISSIQRFTG